MWPARQGGVNGEDGWGSCDEIFETCSNTLRGHVFFVLAIFLSTAIRLFCYRLFMRTAASRNRPGSPSTLTQMIAEQRVLTWHALQAALAHFGGGFTGRRQSARRLGAVASRLLRLGEGRLHTRESRSGGGAGDWHRERGVEARSAPEPVVERDIHQRCGARRLC